MLEVTDASFDEAVLRSRRPVVVDFWAPWCRPCQAVEPLLEALAAEHEDVLFARLDVDANPLAAARFEVLSLPTVIRFEAGAARAAVIGARSRAHYERELAL